LSSKLSTCLDAAIDHLSDAFSATSMASENKKALQQMYLIPTVDDDLYEEDSVTSSHGVVAIMHRSFGSAARACGVDEDQLSIIGEDESLLTDMSH